ncbi:g4062 [Coccomyxa elongata]
MADDDVEIIEVQDSAPTALNPTSDVDIVLTNALADSPVISWRQTCEEVILETPVDIVRAKDVTCNIHAHSLYLAVLEKILVDEPLFAPISPDDSSWEIGDAEEGRKITVSLHKANIPASQCKWKAPFASRNPAKRASKVEE